jgi:hypothetical protein
VHYWWIQSKINHCGDNSVTPFSNDNDNNKSKKLGLNEDEINELEHIMETITTKQKKCLMDAGAKKEDVDVLFNLVGKGPLTTLMQSSYTTLGEIQSTYTTNPIFFCEVAGRRVWWLFSPKYNCWKLLFFKSPFS